jgi:plasmid stabilization system protein ParE
VSLVRLSPEAIDELVEAAVWYRGQRPGLESEFLTEVDRILPLIGSSPASFPRLLDVPEDLVVRRALLPRFPYAVIFMDLRTHVRVLAVAHAKRRPGYWLNRVEKEVR